MKSKTNFTEKPYNRCLVCQHRQVRCDGPRTSAMSLDRWCEFMRDMKEANHLTNADVAAEADVSVKTVDRIMALKCDQDIMRDTARRIENAVIGSANQYPCYLAFEESIPNDSQKLSETMKELEHALSDNRDIKAVLDQIHASYSVEMQTIRDEAQKKIDYLIAQVDRLRNEVDYQRLENDRKAKIIDKWLDS